MNWPTSGGQNGRKQSTRRRWPAYLLAVTLAAALVGAGCDEAKLREFAGTALGPISEGLVSILDGMVSGAIADSNARAGVDDSNDAADDANDAADDADANTPTEP